MQLHIDEEIQKNRPGLNIDPLYNAFTAYRDSLFSLLRPAMVSVLGDTVLKVKMFGDSLDIASFRQLTMKGIIVKIRLHWVEKLTRKLKKVLGVKPTKKHLQEALAKSLSETIRSSTSMGDVHLTTSEGAIAELANAIVFFLSSSLSKLEEIQPYEKLDQFLTNTNITSDSLVKRLNRELTVGSSLLTEMLASGIDKAEHEINDAARKFSQHLISANAGLSVSERSGDLSGGLHYTYSIDSKIQIGAYVNRKFNGSESDTTNPSESLGGIQVRLTFKRVQIDALGSYYLRESNFDGGSKEFGLGLSVVSGNAVIGVAGFYQTVGKSKSTVSDASSIDRNDVMTVGLTLRGKRSGSPGVVISWLKQGSETTPSIGLIYPLSLQ